ncbi:hypothetical protein GALMADRAFT_240028 [Galerina marginata CBS 339.88]|uniref:Uncharacterized protein n=1 Tax=Galerina marginata (strain CBS 339.88) TaxID=685588 RepID=A0A067TS55_GALM3|nr:hypothetical protein GALMADRAFT_240028 [Galerina marginata CBS 339.88]
MRQLNRRLSSKPTGFFCADVSAYQLLRYFNSWGNLAERFFMPMLTEIVALAFQLYYISMSY